MARVRLLDYLAIKIDDAGLVKKVVGILIPISCAEWVAATLFKWVYSTAYVSHLSQLAITLGLITWWASARNEARQQREDVAEDVKQKLVAETDLELT